MIKSRITPTLFAISAIERPCCARCQIRMTLTAVDPGPAGHDFRTFECSKCGRVETIIADDPMKSEKAGWWHPAMTSPW